MRQAAVAEIAAFVVAAVGGGPSGSGGKPKSSRVGADGGGDRARVRYDVHLTALSLRYGDNS